jgi:hypothetical protein
MSDFESGAFNRALPTLLQDKFTRKDQIRKGSPNESFHPREKVAAQPLMQSAYFHESTHNPFHPKTLHQNCGGRESRKRKRQKPCGFWRFILDDSRSAVGYRIFGLCRGTAVRFASGVVSFGSSVDQLSNFVSYRSSGRAVNLVSDSTPALKLSALPSSLFDFVRPHQLRRTLGATRLCKQVQIL